MNNPSLNQSDAKEEIFALDDADCRNSALIYAATSTPDVYLNYFSIDGGLSSPPETLSSGYLPPPSSNGGGSVGFTLQFGTGRIVKFSHSPDLSVISMPDFYIEYDYKELMGVDYLECMALRNWEISDNL